MSKEEKICNMCGLSCYLSEGDHGENSGMIDAEVTGGFFSTPGNGSGALDDLTAYQFSLCEWCLDWLFGKFKKPPVLEDYMHREPITEEFRLAAKRVAEDEWRKGKEKFLLEFQKRNRARSQR